MSTDPSPIRYHTGVASWYGGQWHPSHKYTTAHRSLPKGTVLLITNPTNGTSVKAIVNDRGPFVKGRELDVNKAAALALGFIERGVTTVQYTVVAK